MNDWLKLATTRSVVRRALMYAVIVGAVLITINHGDALLRGEITSQRLKRVALMIDFRGRSKPQSPKHGQRRTPALRGMLQ